MDKVKVNNQVILMRKFVKQGKVRIINKMVKEIKLLQAKKGTEMQVEKYKRKSERCLSEIEIIKKINFDTVSKMSLLNEKDWAAVLSSKTASLEERAFAMLANYEPVQAEVKLFRVRNPRLVLLLPDLIQQWEEKKQQNLDNNAPKYLKASEIKKQKKVKKQKLRNKKPPYSHSMLKEIDKKNIETATEPDQSASELPNEVTTDKVPFTDQIEPLEKSSEEMECIPNINDGEKSLEKKIDSSNIVESETKLSPLKSQTNKTTLISDVKKCTVENKRNLKEISVFNLEALAGQETIPIESESDNDNDQNIPVVKTDFENRKKDPFFIDSERSSESNTESLRDLDSNIDSNINSLLHGNKKFPKKNFAEKSNGKSNNYSSEKNYNHKIPFKGNHSEFRKGHVTARNFPARSYGRGKSSFKPQNRYSYDEKRNFSRNYNNMQNNTKSSQKPFQGGRNVNQHFKDNNFAERNRNQHFKDKNVSERRSNKTETLHPSWEAKRKLSAKVMKILPFQGKKIKFDD